MSPLSPELRRKLETTIKDARDLAETGAEAALKQLAVERAEPFAHLSGEQRELRNRLRARSRQLGDVRGEKGQQEIARVTMQCAYEYWHRMLFARFLAENHLLMHPEGVAVSLEECAELAEEEKVDAWTLASRYAARMLPQIFRPDDPLLQVEFATEHKLGLEKLLELPSEVFLASDSLGWVYQFWQAKRKKEVNDSGDKIGADELSAVTQLFTEDYMVDFLLHNTLGAWWVANHPGEELPVEMPYLRFVEEADPQTADEEGEQEEAIKVSKIPAAGIFPGFPKQAKDLRVLDPCCGSGHFLVAEFNLLVPMRMEEEGLSVRDACDAVLRDNLYGLELDERCTQIAAFALAMAAWTFPGSGGYRPLPQLNIACSGIAISAKREQWIALAGDDQRLKFGMARLYNLFKDAPTLGSLIDPGADRLALEASFDEVQPLLAKALEAERKKGDYAIDELGVAAQGITTAAMILSGKYHLVVTNVPYLARGKQGEVLAEFCEGRYPSAKADLATVFVNRCIEFLIQGGMTALVTPQNWLFLGSYKGIRENLLQNQTWNLIARLGENAFGSPQAAGAFVALLLLTHSKGNPKQTIYGIEASTPRTVDRKAQLLQSSEIVGVLQTQQLKNPNVVIALEDLGEEDLLEKYAISLAGVLNGDCSRFERFFWEVKEIGKAWEFEQSTVKQTQLYEGREGIILWENGQGQLRKFAEEVKERLHDADRRGNQAWGKKGVAVSQMRALPVTLYTGEKFDTNTAVILPRNPDHLLAIWSFCSSSEFSTAVRRISQKINVTNSTLVKVPFDLNYWQKVADEKYPNGLPEAYSNDPTQWIFKGEILSSHYPLQVAIARLLGYRWHEQQPDELDELIDNDGIVCLPAVRGEQPASDRLRALLAKAYGNAWTAQQPKLLTAVGYAGKSLDDWLRNGFFEDHCKRFHKRPFIWQIWDGHKAGFSALVNYHKFDKKLLETLTYTYLGDWLRRQQDDVAQGKSGADAKLLTAQNLQKQLERILEGEAPYDIFIRWKPIEQQPLGWEPDLNDGVRLNIRPFVQANVLRKKPSINWNKDRGKNPPGSPWGEDRLNDLHLTLEEKRKAREALQEENQP